MCLSRLVANRKARGGASFAPRAANIFLGETVRSRLGKLLLLRPGFRYVQRELLLQPVSCEKPPPVHGATGTTELVSDLLEREALKDAHFDNHPELRIDI